MSSRCDIVIAGVGGQGILLASDILGEACILEGLPVKGLETHGMAQRGGSVEAHVRIGCARGPKVPLGGADLLIGFEPLEAARFAAWLKPGGAAVVNSAAVPVPGGAAYPPVESLRGILAARAGALLFLDFAAMAAAAGSARTVNVLMLGAAARFLPLSADALRGAVFSLVKPRFHDVNRAAFEAGLGARA